MNTLNATGRRRPLITLLLALGTGALVTVFLHRRRKQHVARRLKQIHGVVHSVL